MVGLLTFLYGRNNMKTKINLFLTLINVTTTECLFRASFEFILYFQTAECIKIVVTETNIFVLTLHICNSLFER